jgi:site-specific DNA-methyltransferase (adenine-specific)
MKVTDKIDLRNCDNMELMAGYPDNYFDLAIVDPPYGIERFKKGGSVVNKYGDNNREWNNEKPSKEYFNELFRVSKYQIIWGSNNFDLPMSEYFIVWQKSNSMDFSFAMVEQAWTNVKKPAKIFQRFHSQETEKRMHPTQKPKALYKWLLHNYAKEGDKILDTHLGSGSIALACHEMGFELVGCELDKDYYKLMLERFDRETSQHSFLLEL